MYSKQHVSFARKEMKANPVIDICYLHMCQDYVTLTI